jgi:hypothetical protein
MSYVLTHLPAEQLKNRSFTIAGDNTVKPSQRGRNSTVLTDAEILVVQRDIQGV